LKSKQWGFFKATASGQSKPKKAKIRIETGLDPLPKTGRRAKRLGMVKPQLAEIQGEKSCGMLDKGRRKLM